MNVQEDDGLKPTLSKRTIVFRALGVLNRPIAAFVEAFTRL